MQIMLFFFHNLFWYIQKILNVIIDWNFENNFFIEISTKKPHICFVVRNIEHIFVPKRN